MATKGTVRKKASAEQVAVEPAVPAWLTPADQFMGPVLEPVASPTDQSLTVVGRRLPPVAVAPVLPGLPQPVVDARLDPCALGLCADQTSSVQIGGRTMALQGPGATGVAMTNPADAWAARQFMDMADRGLGLAPTDWAQASIAEMQGTPQFQQYVSQLAPVFGDSAWAVATQQMAQANGRMGDLINSDQFKPVLQTRANVGNQALALAHATRNSGNVTDMQALDPSLLPNATLLGPDGGAAFMTGGRIREPLGNTEGMGTASPLAAMVGTPQGYANTLMGALSMGAKQQAQLAQATTIQQMRNNQAIAAAQQRAAAAAIAAKAGQQRAETRAGAQVQTTQMRIDAQKARDEAKKGPAPAASMYSY